MFESPPRPSNPPDLGALVERAPWLKIGPPALLLCVTLVVLYAPILQDLGRQWWDDANYQHGFLVPIVSAFLIWRRRGVLQGIAPHGSTWLGVPVLLLGIGMLLGGDIGAENFLMRSSLIIVLAGLVLFILGPHLLRAVLFPLAFLFFMVPLPAIVFYAITFPLQRMAAEQAAWILDLLGVPVLLDGNIIHLSQISLGVTEACSGIRSLISLMAGAITWAYLLGPSRWTMLFFAVATVPITIIANAGRVVATGLIGQWFGVEYASGFFHELAGWVVYMFAFLCLVALHALLRLAGRLRREVRA